MYIRTMHYCSLELYTLLLVHTCTRSCECFSVSHVCMPSYSAQWHNQQQQQVRVNKLQRVIKTVIVRLSLFVIIYIACGAPSMYIHVYIDCGFCPILYARKMFTGIHCQEAGCRVCIYSSAAFAGAVAVWSEKNRLHLSETPDKIILYIHVS